MPKVAVKGDVTATQSSVPSPKVGAAGSGTWSVSPAGVQYKTYTNFKSGNEIIYEAECAFTFVGANASGATINDDETVTLTATTKLLNKGQHSVLVQGDQKVGPKGNMLLVSATGKIVTS